MEYFNSAIAIIIINIILMDNVFLALLDLPID